MANETAAGDTSKRNWVYGGLLAFIAAGASSCFSGLASWLSPSLPWCASPLFVT